MFVFFIYFFSLLFSFFYFYFILGTEFKTITCAILGVLLAMEIQRGKEGMKSKQFNSEIGATAGCTLRLAKAAHPVVEGEPEVRVDADAWFGSVRCAAALAKEGYKTVLQVKSNSGLFPKTFIEKALEDAPGGVKIVLKGSYHDVPLIAIGYRYSTRTTLCFVATKNAGSTRAKEPYEMKFTDDFGNVVAREVERPEILSEFFKYSNKIDVHNQKRQSNLKLEKRWLTKDPYFRLFTTLVGKAYCCFSFVVSCFYSLFTHFVAGINVVDTYNLCEYHHIINYRLPKEGDHKMTVQRFAGHLSYQLIRNGSGLLRVLKPVRREATQLQEDETVPTAISSESQSSAISSLSANNTPPAVALAERVLTDAQGGLHHQCTYPVRPNTAGKKER